MGSAAGRPLFVRVGSVDEATRLARQGLWPIFHPSDVDRFRLLATELHGASLEIQEGVEPLDGGRSLRLPGEVLSLDSDVDSTAELYAALTGRTHRRVRAISDSCFRANSVLVTNSRALSARLFDQLEELQRAGIAVGVIAARRSGALRTSVTLRAVATWLAIRGQFGISPYRWIDIAPLVDVGLIHGDGRLLLGASASSEMIVAGLGAGAAVLRIASHGDGVDVFLGSAGCLCAVKAIQTKLMGERVPMCVVKGHCHRQHTPLNEATLSQATISVSSLFARVLILDSCAGVPSRSHPIDSRWHLLEQIASHPGVGAVIGTPDLAFGSAVDLDPLVQDIASGVQLGDALQIFSRSEAARHLGRRLFLFGDPCYSAARSCNTLAPTLRPLCETPSFQSKAFQSDVARLRDLTSCFASASSTELIARAIAQRGWARWLESLSRTATSRRWADGRSVCVRCGGLNRHLRAQGELIGDRCVVSCSGCGVRDDRPWERSQAPAALQSLNDGTFLLSGIQPFGTWSAILAIWAYDKDDMIVVPWPSSREKRPQSKFRPNIAIPPGPRRAGFIMVDDTSWEMLTTPFYVYRERPAFA